MALMEKRSMTWLPRGTSWALQNLIEEDEDDEGDEDVGLAISKSEDKLKTLIRDVAFNLDNKLEEVLQQLFMK